MPQPPTPMTKKSSQQAHSSSGASVSHRTPGLSPMAPSVSTATHGMSDTTCILFHQLKTSTPVFVAPAVAIGYDFKPDSRAIAYIKPEDEFFDTQKPALGSLVERTVIDPNGRLLASPARAISKACKPDSNDSTAIYVCTGAATELAGVLYHPWMHVSYARDNRIFFASAKMSLPSSKLDEEKTTIFCCDTLTGAISEIVHQIVLDVAEGRFVSLRTFSRFPENPPAWKEKHTRHLCPRRRPRSFKSPHRR